MGDKQKPSHGSRIQTPSIPDLADGITFARVRLNRAKVKHRGRKLKDGPLVNAVVAWFLAQTEGEQARIAAEGLCRFEALLDGEEPSVPAGDAVPRVKPLLGLGVEVKRVDRKGDDKPAKSRGLPKRGT